MSIIAEFLPLFLVRWYAQAYCQRYLIGGVRMTMPREGVYIVVDE